MAHSKLTPEIINAATQGDPDATEQILLFFKKDIDKACSSAAQDDPVHAAVRRKEIERELIQTIIHDWPEQASILTDIERQKT